MEISLIELYSFLEIKPHKSEYKSEFDMELSFDDMPFFRNFPLRYFSKLMLVPIFFFMRSRSVNLYYYKDKKSLHLHK